MKAIASLQVLPTGGRPIISKEWDSPDEAYREVFQGVKTALRDLRKGMPEPRLAVAPQAFVPPGPAAAGSASTRKVAITGVLLLLVAFGIWGVMKLVRGPGGQKSMEPTQLTAPNTSPDQSGTQLPAGNKGQPAQTQPATSVVQPPDPSLKDEAAWKTAVSENTIGAYQQYNHDYPKGLHNTEAFKAIVLLQKEFDNYMDNAESLYKAGKTVKAKLYLEKAKKLAPLHPRVLALEKKL